MKSIYITLCLILLVSCTTQSTREKQTIYVANDYLIYQNQRFQELSEFVSLHQCDESMELFISPLMNTERERFSNAVADFITMCGKPKVITIQIEDPVIE